MNLTRRSLLKDASWAGAFGTLGITNHQAASENSGADTRDGKMDSQEASIIVDGPAHLQKAFHLAANTYAPNRIKDQLSRTNETGYRMPVSPNGFPVAICMSPDLTFGMLGSRFIENRNYLDTFIGHMNFLPRNMRGSREACLLTSLSSSPSCQASPSD